MDEIIRFMNKDIALAVSLIYTLLAKDRYEGNEKNTDIIMATLYQWIDNLHKGKRIEEYLNGKGYSKLAIYGFGSLGERLDEELQNSQIVEVKYIIDRNKNKKNSVGKRYVSVEECYDILNEIDLVIISVITDFESIKENLVSNGFKGEIMSLEDILFDL